MWSKSNNKLIHIDYRKNTKIRDDIEPLFCSACPSNERPGPELYFSNFLENNNALLWGFYENNAFIGFASFVLYKDICYIFFLAVNDDKRNKGYGTKILSIIKEEFKEYVLLLCYEEVNEKYIDNENRKRREQFYLRNGFINNDLKTYEFGVIFQTVYIGNHKVDFDDYMNIFKIGFQLNDEKFLKNNLKEVK